MVQALQTPTSQISFAPQETDSQVGGCELHPQAKTTNKLKPRNLTNHLLNIVLPSLLMKNGRERQTPFGKQRTCHLHRLPKSSSFCRQIVHAFVESWVVEFYKRRSCSPIREFLNDPRILLGPSYFANDCISALFLGDVSSEWMGNLMVKVLPSLSFESTVICPLCFLMMLKEMLRPKPVPSPTLRVV